MFTPHRGTRLANPLLALTLAALLLTLGRPEPAAAKSGLVGDLEPISICLTFGTPDPCVPFMDDQGNGWGVMDFDAVPENLKPGDRVFVAGNFCTNCIHTFCGSFAGFIFNATVSQCPTTLTPVLGDLNNDGLVNGLDLGIFLQMWMLTAGHGCDGVVPGCELSDVNTDGQINGLDLGLLLSNWSI